MNGRVSAAKIANELATEFAESTTQKRSSRVKESRQLLLSQ